MISLITHFEISSIQLKPFVSINVMITDKVKTSQQAHKYNYFIKEITL